LELIFFLFGDEEDEADTAAAASVAALARWLLFRAELLPPWPEGGSPLAAAVAMLAEAVDADEDEAVPPPPPPPSMAAKGMAVIDKVRFLADNAACCF
jgi:hypothetical protein